MKYAILTDTFITGWANTWVDDEGYPLTFDTLEDAQKALDLYLIELSIDCDLGNIEDYNPEDYKIVEVDDEV